MDLAKLVWCRSSRCHLEIMNEDGSMARVSDLEVIADKFNLKFITIADLDSVSST